MPKVLRLQVKGDKYRGPWCVSNADTEGLFELAHGVPVVRSKL
jgi:hypothetical protein